MSNDKKYDSIMGEAYAVNVLVFLYDQGSAVATEMRTVASNYNTIVKVARKLEEHGLLNISIVTSPRVTHTYRLTEKGKRVAQKLKEIEEII